MDEREVLKDVSAMRGALMISAPFIGSLLMRCRIRVTDKVPTAAVDKGRTIYVNPKFYEKLSQTEKLAVMAHESLHLAFRHAARSEKLVKDRVEAFIYNYAGDAVINHLLRLHGFELPYGSVTPESVAGILGLKVEDVEKLSADAQFRLLKDKWPRIKVRGIPVPGGDCPFPLGSPGEGGDEEDGKEHGGGEKRGKKGGGMEGEEKGKWGGDLRPDLGGEEEKEGKGAGGGEKVEDWDDYWRKAVYRAHVTAKAVGKCPAGLERILGDLLRPKVDLRVLLKDALVKGMGSKVISTWNKPSRRFPFLPGLQRLTIPNVWFLVDTSGSISDDELRHAASVIYHTARKFGSTARLICWDTRPYETWEIKSPNDVLRVKLRGGGGTEIASTLKKVEKEMKPRDSVVILTDGFIGDIEEPEVQVMLSRIAAKASACVFVTTAAEPDLPPKWRTIPISS